MTTETLTWHPAQAGSMPDADTTVLMWVIDPIDGHGEWFAGWWDGDCWRDASSGAPVYGEVTHWASPEGPQ